MDLMDLMKLMNPILKFVHISCGRDANEANEPNPQVCAHFIIERVLSSRSTAGNSRARCLVSCRSPYGGFHC